MISLKWTLKKMIKLTLTQLHRYSNMMNLISLKLNRLFLLVLVLLLSSCYSSKKLDYLQSKHQTLVLPHHSKEEYKAQPSDVLSIRVQSRDPEQTAFFNLGSLNNGVNQTNVAAFYNDGYSIDSNGMIKLAIVGELKVSDLTIEEIRDLVQNEIDKYLLNATVTVQLMNFKVSVLGDVGRPGTNYLYNNQVTIFEALSAAGDLNFTAKRKKVRLIRQVNDASIVVKLDLTKPSIIKSPYYFLQPNDVIYVETSKSNIFNNNTGVLTLLLTAVTTAALVLNVTSN